MKTQKLKLENGIFDRFSRGWWPVIILCLVLGLFSYLLKLALDMIM